MNIVRATHLGMCFGVRDAIRFAQEKSAIHPVTVLGDLVHNESVLEELRGAGVQFRQNAGEIETSSVMITAHGASQRTLSTVRERGLNVLEATCPLVQAAHRAVTRLVSEGFHPVIIGKRDHVEVRGLTEDLEEFDVILEDTDVAALKEYSRFGIAAQTTQPIDRVRRLVRLVGDRFPRSQVRFVDTVCQPTKQRQTAAIDMARKADVVIVIGGAHSNNTRELVQTCGRFCSRVYHVQKATDLRAEWFEGADTVGLTAGTSTPDRIIDEIEEWVLNLGRVAKKALKMSSTQ